MFLLFSVLIVVLSFSVALNVQYQSKVGHTFSFKFEGVSKLLIGVVACRSWLIILVLVELHGFWSWQIFKLILI